MSLFLRAWSRKSNISLPPGLIPMGGHGWPPDPLLAMSINRTLIKSNNEAFRDVPSRLCYSQSLFQLSLPIRSHMLFLGSAGAPLQLGGLQVLGRPQGPPPPPPPIRTWVDQSVWCDYFLYKPVTNHIEQESTNRATRTLLTLIL